MPDSTSVAGAAADGSPLASQARMQEASEPFSSTSADKELPRLERSVSDCSEAASTDKQQMNRGLRRARRCVTDAYGVDAASWAFQAAANQNCGPLLAQAGLPGLASTAILLPSARPVVSEGAVHAHLLRAAAGLLGSIGVVVCAIVMAIRLLSGRWWVFLASWMALEIAFWVWFKGHAAALDAQPRPHKPKANDPILHFNRLIAHAKFYRDKCQRAMDWRSYVSRWFKNTPAECVRMGNLEEMIAYGFFYSTRCGLEAEGRWPVVQAMAAQLSNLAAPSRSPSTANFASGSDLNTIETKDQSFGGVAHSTFASAAPPPLPAAPFAIARKSSVTVGGVGPATTARVARKATLGKSPITSATAIPAVGRKLSSAGPLAAPTAVNSSYTENCATRHQRLESICSSGGSSEEDSNAGCLKLADGYEPGLSFMAHLWEPLKWHHRPLAMYLVIELLHYITWGALAALGLRYISVDGTTFYYRPGPMWRTGAAAPANLSKGSSQVPPGAPPLLLLHGVGLGLLPYLLIVVRLSASGLPLLLPETRHVSMRLCLHVPTACEMAARVVTAMDRLGVPQACVVAHSYGTFVASRLVQQHAQRAVRSLALVDPVCFGMFLPSLLGNFIYRTPLDAYREGGVKKMLRNMLVYLVSRDVHAAAAFCRRFFWTDVNLWAEELPPKSLIVLAGADELLHADEVRQVVSGAYVGVPRRSEPLVPEELGCPSEGPSTPRQRTPNSQARVLYHPTAGHADWLLDNKWQAEVVEQVLSLAFGEDAIQHVTRRATSQPISALVPASLPANQGPGAAAAAHTAGPGSVGTGSGTAGALAGVRNGSPAGSEVVAIKRANTTSVLFCDARFLPSAAGGRVHGGAMGGMQRVASGGLSGRPPAAPRPAAAGAGCTGGTAEAAGTFSGRCGSIEEAEGVEGGDMQDVAAQLRGMMAARQAVAAAH